MQNKGLLLVVSGPSGVGKGSVLACARSKYNNFRYSVSVTTRSMRDDEIDGVHYHFRSKEQFDKMVENGEFLEHMKVHDYDYGTPIAGVQKNLADGYDMILEIDTQGASEVKKIFPDCIKVFVVAKKVAIIEERLRDRKTETKESFHTRMKNSLQELKQAMSYDYIIINDKVEQCADDFLAIINVAKGKLPASEVEKFKAKNNKNLIDNLLMEAKKYDD